jgi:folate-binding protein YgfZ
MFEASVSFEKQYHALRSGNALVPLINWSSVTLTGADRQSFLQSFCTNDVNRLAPGESCEAFFTNVKGKTLAHGLIACSESELAIVGVPAQSAALIEHLDRYVIREDVQLRDATAERSCVLDCSGLLPRCFTWNLVGNVAGGVTWVAPSVRESLVETCVDRGLTVVGEAAFTAARIEAGVPLFGVDFDENNLPQEIGRDSNAISFTKGCYLGQETVARIDALGHVNQRVVGVRFAGINVPVIGSEVLRDGKVVGRITSATLSPRLGAALALAMVRREANAIGARLESSVGECEVVALPVQLQNSD